jgi:hypothetical protein
MSIEPPKHPQLLYSILNTDGNTKLHRVHKKVINHSKNLNKTRKLLTLPKKRPVIKIQTIHQFPPPNPTNPIKKSPY